MKQRKTLPLLKAILILPVLAAIIFSFSLFNLGNISNMTLHSIYHSLSLIKLDSHKATKLLKPINIVMAGQEEEILLASNYINQVPERFILANLGAADRLQVSRAYQPIMDKISLPAVLQEEKDTVKVTNDYSYKLADFNKDYLIAFYCTHSAETYVPDSGSAKLDGERGLINQVSETLAAAIKNYGINTHFIDTIHDYPEYNKSYINSRETIKEIVENENVIAVFDIHRDSILGSKTAYTIDIEGKKSARVLIIVGTDERKDHPKWRENLEFAQKLQDKGEELYPGLIKAVRTQAGTYNQEYHPRALLLEFGDDQNSLAEAKYAAELMAKVIIETMKEEVN